MTLVQISCGMWRTLKPDAEALLATRIGEYKCNRTIAFQGSVHRSDQTMTGPLPDHPTFSFSVLILPFSLQRKWLMIVCAEKGARTSIICVANAVLSYNTEITQLNMNVQCHKWSELTVENTFVEQQAKLIRMRCTTCPTSFYMPTDGQFSVSYFQNKTSVPVQGTSDSKDLSCTPCPPGANCPGNDITAKPNFWGSNPDHVISMH